LGRDEARELCARRDSTLPIITDEDVDNVFQQFIASDAYKMIQNRSVWIAAHIRPFNASVSWHWIDGKPSGTMKKTLHYPSTGLSTLAKVDFFCDCDNNNNNNKTTYKAP